MTTIRDAALLLAAVLVSAPGSAAGECFVPYELLERDLAEMASHVTPEGLVRFEVVPAPSLSATVCRALVLDRVPPSELVYVGRAGQWELSLANKSQGPRWQMAVNTALPSAVAPWSDDALSLATDLAKILVDPDPRRGIVVLSAGSIPVLDDSSDRRRDLKRQGLPEARIAEVLREGVPDALAPPSFVGQGDCLTLRFVTWHFYGGELVEWHVTIGARHHISRTTLAIHVGSFGLYY